jgi:hypothetical protein
LLQKVGKMAKPNNDILDFIQQDDNAVTTLIKAMKALAGENVAVNA